ncbi:MAG: hypothetical protein MZV49_01975 [Rhodopseudomonas palustris]|nr:hypothetical protein [Rhodopseudomonas palustris]
MRQAGGAGRRLEALQLLRRLINIGIVLGGFGIIGRVDAPTTIAGLIG